MAQQLRREQSRLTFLVLSILLVAGVQWWLWQYVLDAATALQAVRTSEEQRDILEERLAEVKNDRQQWEGAFGQLAVIFPQAGGTTQAVERLEEVADAVGVRLSVNAIEQLPSITSKNSAGLLPLVVTMETTAPVDRLLEYVDRVEHVPEATRIWQYSIEPLSGNTQPVAPGEAPIYRLSMRVAFYLQENI